MAESYQDQGYAWVILFCNFAWYFVIAGTHKSLGVLYVDLMDLFQEGALATSLVSTVFTAVWCLTSPFFGYLVDRISPRLLTIAGGLIAGAALISCAFAPSLIIFTAAFGVLGGLSLGMMEPAVIATLTRYFHRRLGLANGIAYSGEGLGAMVLPLVMTASTEAFTVRGTMLVLGGIWLNCCVIGALLRPPPRDIKLPTNGHASSEEPTEQSKSEPNLESMQIPKEIESGDSRTSTPCERSSEMNTYRYVDLVKNTHLLRVIFILFCGGVSSYGVTFIFPALALELGSSKMYASLTVSVAGACEVISKLSVGVLVDSKLLEKHTIAAVLFLMAGCGAMITAWVNNPTALMVYAVVLGLTGLNFTCLAGPLLTDCVPRQALGSAMGLYLSAYGAGICVGYPLIGATKNYFESYVESLLIFGGFYILGALVSVFDIAMVNKIFSNLFRKSHSGVLSVNP